MDVAEWTEEKPKIEDKMKTMPKQKLKSKTSVKSNVFTRQNSNDTRHMLRYANNMMLGSFVKPT